MPTPSAQALPTPVPGVLFQALDDGAVLLSPATELYFGLNHVGARVWELLPPATSTLEELCARFREIYPDAGDTLERDVAALLDQLLTEGLVNAAARA